MGAEKCGYVTAYLRQCSNASLRHNGEIMTAELVDCNPCLLGTVAAFKKITFNFHLFEILAQNLMSKNFRTARGPRSECENF